MRRVTWARWIELCTDDCDFECYVEDSRLFAIPRTGKVFEILMPGHWEKLRGGPFIRHGGDLSFHCACGKPVVLADEAIMDCSCGRRYRLPPAEVEVWRER